MLVGSSFGRSEGLILELLVGFNVTSSLGDVVGRTVGTLVGADVGVSEGLPVGVPEGAFVRTLKTDAKIVDVGLKVGRKVGEITVG